MPMVCAILLVSAPICSGHRDIHIGRCVDAAAWQGKHVAERSVATLATLRSFAIQGSPDGNPPCVDKRIVRHTYRMNGPTRDAPRRRGSIRDVQPLDVPSASAAAHEAEDGVFWDAYWTLDEEWHPDEREPRQTGSTSRNTPPATSWSTGTRRVAVPSASPAPRLRA